MIRFASERLTRALWDEAMPLLEAHWKEVAFYDDIPLSPDWNVYASAAEAGNVIVFTARKDFVGTMVGAKAMRFDNGVLVGYALYFVKHAPHYQNSYQASQDVIYLDPSVRGRTGMRFIQYADNELQDLGVQVVFQHMKVGHPALGRVLERLGYKQQDIVYSRRLDQAV